MDNNRTLSALIPSVGWLRSYPRAWLRPDVIAGLTAAAVVIPKAMAYATIAASVLLGLQALGVETVGTVPGGFPAFVWP